MEIFFNFAMVNPSNHEILAFNLCMESHVKWGWYLFFDKLEAAYKTQKAMPSPGYRGMPNFCSTLFMQWNKFLAPRLSFRKGAVIRHERLA